MVRPAFDLQRLIPGSSSSDCIVITATNRLRNRCQQYVGSRQQKSAWYPAPVFSLQEWLENGWQMLQNQMWGPALKQVLNREQRLQLWQDTLPQALSSLLNSSAICKNADDATAALLQWRFDPARLSTVFPAQTHGELPLGGWYQSFAESANALQGCTPDQRDTLILEAFEQKLLPLQSGITLLGFDQISPLHSAILEAAADKVEHAEPVRLIPESITAQGFNSEEEELEAAACWASDALTQNPSASVGIVVNNLGQKRDQVARIFAGVLEPQSFNPAQQRYTLPFNFSAGVPFARTGIGQQTLQCLELLRERWQPDSLMSTLYSPAICTGDADLHLATTLCNTLARSQQVQVTGSQLRYEAQRVAEKLGNDSDLPARLNRIYTLQTNWKGAPLAQWASRFSDTLLALGWPGQRVADSEEYQQLQLWESVLADFSASQATPTPVSLETALNQLRQLCNRTPFQAETADSPVQVLGVLEGASLHFDHLWLAGFGQNDWPVPPSPNPLIPIEWQAENGLPRASQERELQLAEDLTDGYLGAAPDIRLSFCAIKDEQHQQLSPLFGGIECITSGKHRNAISEFSAEISRGAAYETLNDAQMPALPQSEKDPVRGGAGVLKAQAVCPFNAQVHYRLGAQRHPEPQPGLGPADRGNMVHEMLAHFWANTHSYNALMALSPEQLQQQMREAAEGAITALRPKLPQLAEPFWEIECGRLLRVLDEWIQIEKQRPVFSIAKVEERDSLSIAGLRFSVRLDRVDTLGDGSQLIIDYKTGSPTRSAWFSDPLRDPQLPLYAAVQPNASAIAFARLKPGHCSFTGTGDLSEPIDGIDEPEKAARDKSLSSWQEVKGRWHAQLETLATAFAHGEASVHFPNPADEKKQTELWALNRFPERDTIAAGGSSND
ncbi:PD-(D/E)XK nuclease family protein [Biformimicrobium ophioploci]|uniref:PD-(D/E)XK nuclease family protein n=1 Tax=Biformimicrobium ophioploci TaxID=3036711 RepID=A0ABQ6M1B8_9GAMM|nr:PD-(D/E)XK nuclease family protein [Microbulbifer sp. NKW57]GMG88149.1 PD-(D/E)XK nuclease family protein [Microbulbifer sp. NKW57]